MGKRSSSAEAASISDDLFGLSVTHVSTWIFNSYILHDPSGAVVVDPGLPCVSAGVVDALSTRDGGHLAHIICTHSHPDHVGGVSTLQQHHPDAAVHLPERCAHYLAGETPRAFKTIPALTKFLPVFAEQPFQLRALTQFATAPRRAGFGGTSAELKLDFEPGEYLVDDAPLFGAPGWDVVHVPGHTDDSTAFYHRDSETLCSGDAVVVQDGRAWFNPEWVDRDLSGETEERLRSLPVSHLLPGHGPPLAAPDVWATARRATEPPSGTGVLARCSRRLGRWS